MSRSGASFANKHGGTLAGLLRWLMSVIRRALPWDDDRIGLPNVEPPADEQVGA